MEAEQHEQEMNAFLVGPIFDAAHAVQLCHLYLSRQGGSIFNLASTAAKRWDMSNYGVNAAEKEAIRAVTRAAASEWGLANIAGQLYTASRQLARIEKMDGEVIQEGKAFVRFRTEQYS